MFIADNEGVYARKPISQLYTNLLLVKCEGLYLCDGSRRICESETKIIGLSQEAYTAEQKHSELCRVMSSLAK